MEEKKTTLTLQDRQDILDTLESLPKSEETKVMQEIANNPDVVDEDHTGYLKEATITSNPVSGESTVLDTEPVKTNVIPDNLGDFSEEEFEKFIDSYEPEKISYTINAEDVKAHNDSTLLGEMELDDAAILDLIKLLNDVKVNKNIRFKELPESVKEHINKYLATYAGIGPTNVSAKANEARNAIANDLMVEYLKNIEMSKYIETFNYKVEHLYDETANELSPLFKLYNDDNRERIKKLISDTEDPEKKQTAQNVLDAITAAFDMSTMITLAPKTKMKKFEVDKPDRVYDSIHAKFRGTKNSLYDIYGCAHTLARHLYFDQIITDKQTARDTAVKIMILYCKECQNYNVDNPAHYAFMYYFTYNIYLLDMYKGSEYEEYTKEYYTGLKKLIEVLR